MSSTPIRIILVDDHKLVRQLWFGLLENNKRFKIIAECETGDEAILKSKELKPDILLVDINMSPTNGFAVTKRVVAENPSIKIIGLSVNNQPTYAIRMLELGGKGYLTKTSSLAEIIKGIIEVYNGNEYICDEVRKLMPPKNMH
jgi:DNA-binding NarL/FixJ family response regulator